MTKLSQSVFASILMLSSFPGFAASIANGEFTTDLSGWTVIDDNGTGVQSGGQAQLSTGDGVSPFSTVLVQGDDGNFNFPSPITLSASDHFFAFDASFSDLGADGSEAGGGSPDSLSVWLYDSLDNTYDTLITQITLGGAASYLFDLSPFSGRSVAFSFELADEDDGRNSRVAIDNVRIETRIATVPLPPSLLLFLTGLAGLRLSKIRLRFRGVT